MAKKSNKQTKTSKAPKGDISHRSRPLTDSELQSMMQDFEQAIAKLNLKIA